VLRLLVAAAALLAVLLAMLAGCHGPGRRGHRAQSSQPAESGGDAAGARVADLVIAPAAVSSTAQLLYPGTRGDAVLSVRNPNPFAVTLTGVWLPTATTFADGYADSALLQRQPGCAAATPSLVAWADTDAAPSLHVLSTPIVA